METTTNTALKRGSFAAATEHEIQAYSAVNHMPIALAESARRESVYKFDRQQHHPDERAAGLVHCGAPGRAH